MSLILFALTILICSLPFGLFWTGLLHNQDPREQGSGNIGMSNVWRNNGATAGTLTLIGDLGKGLFCVWLATDCPSETQQLIAVTAVLSHCYSIYLDFDGGKGVATAGGVILGYCLTHFLILVGVWLLAFRLCKQHGLASLVTVVAVVPTTAILQPDNFWTYMVLCVIVLWRHKNNINEALENFDSLPN